MGLDLLITVNHISFIAGFDSFLAETTPEVYGLWGDIIQTTPHKLAEILLGIYKTH